MRTKYNTDRDKFKYVEDLIDDDLAEHGGKLGVATEGLLWLKRYGAVQLTTFPWAFFIT